MVIDTNSKCRKKVENHKLKERNGGGLINVLVRKIGLSKLDFMLARH